MSDTSVNEEQRVKLLGLADQLRPRAAKTGSLSALWDVISELDRRAKGKQTVIRDITTQELIEMGEEHVEKYVKESSRGGRAMIPQSRLDEIRRRYEALTKGPNGPWTCGARGGDESPWSQCRITLDFGPTHAKVVELTGEWAGEVAQFACASFQDIPALLGEITRLRAELAKRDNVPASVMDDAIEVCRIVDAGSGGSFGPSDEVCGRAQRVLEWDKATRERR